MDSCRYLTIVFVLSMPFTQAHDASPEFIGPKLLGYTSETGIGSDAFKVRRRKGLAGRNDEIT